MPLEMLAEERLPFTSAEIAADLGEALSGVADGPRCHENRERVVESVAANFSKHQQELQIQPNLAAGIKRQITAESLAAVLTPRFILDNAEHWAGIALHPEDVPDDENGETAAEGRHIVQDAVKNYVTLATSRRLNDMQQFAKMTVKLLHDAPLGPDSRTQLIDSLNQLLYAQQINVRAENEDAADALADFKRDLLRRVLFDLEPNMLITPASADEVSVEISLGGVDVKGGLSPELLRAEGSLLATIAHMPDQEFIGFLRQQISMYEKPQADSQENKRLSELSRIVRHLRGLHDAIVGHGGDEPSALVQHDAELKGVPNAAANALARKIAALSNIIREHSGAGYNSGGNDGPRTDREAA